MTQAGMAEWGKTQKGKDNRGIIDGMFGGRPIIGHDTAINGGVCIGERPREAVVVDDSKYVELREAYDEFLAFARLPQNQKKNLFVSILEYCRVKIPMSEDGRQEVVDEFGVSNDGLISLTKFFDRGGNCVQGGLLAAYLVEKLNAERKLKGSFGFYKNGIRDRGGHAWVRVNNAKGELVAIIDPAKNYVGDLTADYRNDQKKPDWSYLHPDDK